MTIDSGSELELAQRLFRGPERLGWEYVEPDPLRPSPYLDKKPVWHEPLPPDVSRHRARRDEAKRELPKRLLILGFLGLIVLSSLGSQPGLGLLGLIGVGALATVWIGPIVTADQKIESAMAAARAARASEWNRYQQAMQRWHSLVAKDARAEKERRETAMLWFPVQLESQPSRIDVFGGTGDGWASLLATFGSSVLSAGAGMLVLDFSEQDICRELAALASASGVAVRRLDLPDASEGLNLLGGLGAEEVAELLAEALQTMRRSGADADLRDLDVDLIATVTEQLEQPLTFTRIAAGLRVLQRRYDGSSDGSLSVEEMQRLVARVDTVGQGDRVQDELRFVCNTLELLRQRNVSASAGPEDILLQGSLTIIATSGDNQRRKDFTDRVVFQAVLQHIRRRRQAGRQGMLVVAGADHLGKDALETMAKRARISGLRLLYLIEHLRDDLQQLLGGSDSAALMMRLGNAQEAAAAAEFIGRGHKFVLSQLTKQVGTTFTRGESSSWGEQSGISETEGFSSGTTSSGLFHGSSNRGRSVSFTSSRSQSWQDTRSSSEAHSTTDGTTESRVYEFTVEPTEIQSLPATAFVLVEAGHGGRRVAVGDCNPGIVTLPRVAQQP